MILSENVSYASSQEQGGENVNEWLQ
jgi:hypothetical protein